MKKTQKGTFRRILRYLKPYSGYLVLTIFLAIVTVALTLAVPYFVGLAIDECNESALTDGRIERWVSALKNDGAL